MADRTRLALRPLLFEAGMAVAGLVFAFPLYILVVLALKPQSEWIRQPLALPGRLYLDNITQAWSQANLGTAMLSSILVTVSSVVLLVGLGSLAAYWIARRGGRLGYATYVLFLAGMILPFQLALIPLYKLMRDLGLLGSPLSLILFYPALKLPLTIFLYAGYIRSLPRSYEEAATIDGANQLQTFLLVVLPMLRPITGTVIILNAVFVWNDFLTPLLYLSGSDWATVPVAIYSFAGQESSDLGLLFGGLLAAMVPVLIAFLVFQKRMMQGFAGGVKG